MSNNATATAADFKIQVFIHEGEKFATVYHVASQCGADFYESGEELEWQDNNGLASNCSDEIVTAAREAAKLALT